MSAEHSHVDFAALPHHGQPGWPHVEHVLAVPIAFSRSGTDLRQELAHLSREDLVRLRDEMRRRAAASECAKLAAYERNRASTVLSSGQLNMNGWLPSEDYERIAEAAEAILAIRRSEAEEGDEL